MKKYIAAIIGLACWVSVHAQTNQVPNLIPTSDPLAGIGQIAQSIYNGAQSAGLLNSSNYAPLVYANYAPKAKDHWGGGAAVAFNFPGLSGTNGNVGTLFGADWLGSWSLVNASVTLKAKIRPLNIGVMSWLPDSVRLVQVEPIAIGGVWTSLGGSSAGGTLWDIGGDVNFGHWLGGQFTAGVTWGEWVGNTKEPGHRYHPFVGWRWGF